MPPNINTDATDEIVRNSKIAPDVAKPKDRKIILVWRNILLYGHLHVVGLCGIYFMFTSAKLITSIQAILLYQLGMLGTTAGAHRLWAHRSYKSKWPLSLILIVLQTIAYQNSVIEWVKDHRVHHKYSETDADPHNAKRGFFFAHMGWLMCRKHPEVRSKTKLMDVSDLQQDPILAFQHKYYIILMPLICLILPTLIPVYFWNETLINAYCLTMLRCIFTSHCVWTVNSVAHLWGQKPYDRFINPAENLGVSLLACGEGWHNFHHTFPSDYKTSEFGTYTSNFSTAFIDFMAKIGWAYDLKSTSEDVIKKRILRTGNGTRYVWSQSEDIMKIAKQAIQ